MVLVRRMLNTCPPVGAGAGRQTGSCARIAATESTYWLHANLPLHNESKLEKKGKEKSHLGNVISFHLLRNVSQRCCW